MRRRAPLVAPFQPACRALQHSRISQSQDQLHRAIPAEYSAAGRAGLVVRSGISGRGESPSLWIHECEPGDSDWIHCAGCLNYIGCRTPFPNMGGIQDVHDWGTGNYNAFSAKATRRFSNGLNVISSYTWSKSLDDTSGVRNQGNDDLYPQNNRCLLANTAVPHSTLTIGSLARRSTSSRLAQASCYRLRTRAWMR